VTPRPRAKDGPLALRASGDRWLFGYADVVTLLFACFAALYATQNSAAPAVEAAAAVASAPVVTPKPTPTVTPASPLSDEIAALLATKDEDQVHIDVATSEAGTVISLAEAGSFPAGKADLTPAAQRVIAKLADLLRSTNPTGSSRPPALRVWWSSWSSRASYPPIGCPPRAMGNTGPNRRTRRRRPARATGAWTSWCSARRTFKMRRCLPIMEASAYVRPTEGSRACC
jgi:flagellar motor protein MotB